MTRTSLLRNYSPRLLKGCITHVTALTDDLGRAVDMVRWRNCAVKRKIKMLPLYSLNPYGFACIVYIHSACARYGRTVRRNVQPTTNLK